MLQLNVNLFFTIINLVVLYLLLKKFLIKPVTKVIEARERMIADGLSQASSAREEAKELKNQYEAALSCARQESEKIVQKAQVQAAATMAAVGLGIDAKTIPYVLKMADLSRL